MHRGIVKQDIAALVKLGTERIETVSQHRGLDAAFNHVRMKSIVPSQKPSDMQPPTMAGGRYRTGGAYRLPRVRQIRLSAEASPIKIP
jgi:hypothetical protein